jgi:hypothetical protein
MCGLWGVAGVHLNNADKENAKRLAMMSTTRGEDSTGALWAWRHKKKVKHTTLVQVAKAFEFIDEPSVREKFAIPNLCMIMGHDRAATLGAVNMNNAHPIVEGKIIGCHNGTIPRYKPDKDEEERMSDSRMLFRKINQDPIPALIDADEGAGAYAVTYYDTERATLNIARNYSRPLFAMWSRKGPATLYWASEQWMLETCRRTGYDVADFDNPMLVESGQLFTFDVKQNMRPLEKKEIKKPFVPFVPRGPSVPLIGPSNGKKPCTTGGTDTAKAPTTLYKRDAGVSRELILDRDELGLQWSVKFTDDTLEQHIKDNILVTRPQSNVKTKATRFPNLGLIEYYNDYGEFIKREWMNPKAKVVTLPIMYKGYAGVLYPAANIQQLVSKNACACCDCLCDMEDQLHWISKTEFVCDTCVTDGTIEFFVHKSQVHKGEIVDDEGR